MIKDTFEFHAFFNTLRITVPNRDGQSHSIGTGFICNAALGIDGKVGTFLVSNRHVFGDESKTVILNFHKADPRDISSPRYGEVESVRIEKLNGFYYDHPNPDVDLACINISAFARTENGIFYKGLTVEFLAEDQLAEVFPGQEVMFIGYPDNRFDAANNLPLLRKGHLATLPFVDFNGRPQLVIDAQVYPGSSGSPVFIIRKGKYRLLGVVSETMIRHEKLQTIPAVTALATQQTIGLGIVIKAKEVAFLLDHAARGLTERVRVAGYAQQGAALDPEDAARPPGE